MALSASGSDGRQCNAYCRYGQLSKLRFRDLGYDAYEKRQAHTGRQKCKAHEGLDGATEAETTEHGRWRYLGRDDGGSSHIGSKYLCGVERGIGCNAQTMRKIISFF